MASEVQVGRATVTHLRLYGDRSGDDGVVGKVLDATVELLRLTPYAAITTRSIADRAGVDHADLCAYFRSKNAIVAEVYLELLRAAPLTIDVEQSAKARVTAQFEQLTGLLADQPQVAAACFSALICEEASVRAIRRHIHQELRRRVRAALRSGAWPEVAETLEFGLIGALVHASCAGHFRGTAAALANVVTAVLPDEY